MKFALTKKKSITDLKKLTGYILSQFATRPLMNLNKSNLNKGKLQIAEYIMNQPARRSQLPVDEIKESSPPG